MIQSFTSGPFQTNAIVISCDQTRKAAIIDPSPGSMELITGYIEKENLQPEKILLTHSHWDHTADVSKVKKKYSIPVFIHEEDKKNLIFPGADGLPLIVEIEGVEPDHLIKEGDTIMVGQLHLEVIHTPGHSPGGVCFYCSEENILISGDTLFKGSIGNLSLPTSDPDTMWPSLKKLHTLPAETAVYPGHGPTTTIGAENWLPKAKELFGFA